MAKAEVREIRHKPHTGPGPALCDMEGCSTPATHSMFFKFGWCSWMCLHHFGYWRQEHKGHRCNVGYEGLHEFDPNAETRAYHASRKGKTDEPR